MKFGGGRLALAAGDVAGAIATVSAELKSDLIVMGRAWSTGDMARVNSLYMTLSRRTACPVVVV